jgi:hypothetical protein
MGCNCGKSKAVQAPGAGAGARRATVYQVMSNSVVVSEFSTLPEARKKATEVGGRVKVTSKIVT